MHYPLNFSVQEGFESILSAFNHLNPGEKASVLPGAPGAEDQDVCDTHQFVVS